MLKKGQSIKSLAIGITARLISLALVGVLLVAAQTYLVQQGSITLDQSLNVVIHLLVIAVVGVITVMLSKEQNSVIYVMTVALFYILLLFIGVVIYDGISKDFVYAVSGGAAGLIITILVSLAHKKRSGRWSRKKYSR